MDSLLYLYDADTLKILKENLQDYRFVDIAWLLHKWDTIPKLADSNLSGLGKSVIDITNITKDGNFFRIFIQQYIWTLTENVPDIHFCINCNQLETFEERFPYMFPNERINSDFHHDPCEECKEEENLVVGNSLPLYVYDKPAVVKKLHQNGSLLSLSELINECEGIVFRYNIDQISKIIQNNGVEYIDLSSITKTLKIRSDLVFQFEILLHCIFTTNKIKYCAEKSLTSELQALFPFSFSDALLLVNGEDMDTSDDKSMEEIDVENVTSLASIICDELRGHAAFKMDFQHSFLKFSFLNCMKERRILSILLCGDSGIGKTEFAKIMSNTMYPQEALIKINFGNYSTEGVLNSLIGSPLGYIGSEEGGELINKISMSKSRVILIDEFERATPSVFNFFYELLEDGAFTDRHGVVHNLNRYIIVFTSNMTQDEYHKHIPNSLKSRFDMVYYFEDLSIEEKKVYIFKTASALMEKMRIQFSVQVSMENIRIDLDTLVDYNNLRNIKRRVEDIVFDEFFRCYKNGTNDTKT